MRLPTDGYALSELPELELPLVSADLSAVIRADTKNPERFVNYRFGPDPLALAIATYTQIGKMRFATDSELTVYDNLQPPVVTPEQVFSIVKGMLEDRMREGAGIGLDYNEGTGLLTISRSFFSDTVLLMNFEGPNNSTVFIDSSNYARELTGHGGVKISTAHPPSGATSSGLFDGIDDYISTPFAPSLDLSGGAFTLRGRLYVEATGGTQIVLVKDGFNGSRIPSYAIYVASTGQISGLMGDSRGLAYYIVLADPTPVTYNTWYDFSFIRSGEDVSLYVNGVLVSSAVFIFNNIDTGGPLYIGNDPSAGSYFKGNMQAIEVIKGRAIYP